MEHLFDEDDEVTTATEGVEQTTLLIARLESALNRTRARLTVWRAQERQEERRRLAERLGLRVARSILVIEVSLGNCLRRLFVTDRHGRADCQQLGREVARIRTRLRMGTRAETILRESVRSRDMMPG